MEKNRKRRNGGFTLAELLIVVAIIGALVGIMIPNFTGQIEKAREAADVATLRAAYADASNKYLLEGLATDNKITVNGIPLNSNGAIESIDTDALPFVLPSDFSVSKGTYNVTFDFSKDIPVVSFAKGA